MPKRQQQVLRGMLRVKPQQYRRQHLQPMMARQPATKRANPRVRAPRSRRANRVKLRRWSSTGLRQAATASAKRAWQRRRPRPWGRAIALARRLTARARCFWGLSSGRCPPRIEQPAGPRVPPRSWPWGSEEPAIERRSASRMPRQCLWAGRCHYAAHAHLQRGLSLL